MRSENAAQPRICVQARGILFDMDGVLVSSLGSVERSWQRWAERHGLDVAATIKAAHGRRAIDTLRNLWPEGDHEAELKAIEDLEVADNVDLKVLEGVMPILRSVPQRFWTVVTSATDKLARARLADGGIPVPKQIVTADIVAQGKPSPEPYRKGAEILGLPPGECIVIEDSSAGVKAGHAAGCKVLATTFSHPIEALAEADWIVESLAKVEATFLPQEQRIELKFEPLARSAV